VSTFVTIIVLTRSEILNVRRSMFANPSRPCYASEITEWIFITRNTMDGITRWKLAGNSILFHIRETSQYFKQTPNHTPSTYL